MTFWLGVETWKVNLRNYVRFSYFKGQWFKVETRKMVFMRGSVIYLRMKIDKNGMLPVKKRNNAPRDTTELKSFIGMLTYYHKHLPDISNLLEPLHKLLRKDEEGKWEARGKDVFEKAKELLMSADLLVHYDLGKPL